MYASRLSTVLAQEHKVTRCQRAQVKSLAQLGWFLSLGTLASMSLASSAPCLGQLSIVPVQEHSFTCAQVKSLAQLGWFLSLCTAA